MRSSSSSNNQNKTLVVLGNYGHMGGAERQAIHYIEYLRNERDAPVSVLGWYGEGPLSDKLRSIGCEIFNFPYVEKLSGWKKIKNLFDLMRYIRTEIRPDVILPFVSIHSKPICLTWKHTGARYAWWNQQDEGRGMFGTSMERRALLNARHITSNSDAGATFIANTYGIPRDRILIYNNGIPVPNTDSLTPIWRDNLGLPPNRLLVSMIANITQFKDHETLLKAWAIIKDQWTGPSEVPYLALAGHLNEANHVLRLKALAFDLGIGECIRFLGSIDTTNQLIWESDIVVHSSIKEGCPNAVCEAMALGKPAIGTDIPGMRQALGDQHSEFVYAHPKDERHLAQKLLSLLTDANRREQLGSVNKKRILSDFSIKGMNQLFDQLVQEGLDQHQCKIT
ncbi:glycosyltransferase family 4 protein [Cerasicoccus frondis]|uniref:glycosyltransferase family 4 protein n=1 Tax=Cerasicoccus frondis TaxID=490090 RepID=UPI00285255F3|nr:glycosyltransferase family 4 protein [Cerasicoccus frondis]